jgi:N-methylhydantoinase A
VNHMSHVIKRVTTARGLDARDFAIVAYGGAGPLHATLVARELQIPRVIIPNAPGHFSAYGMLVSDLRRDFVRTLFSPLTADALDAFGPEYEEMEARGRAEIKAAAPGEVKVVVVHAADMRYVGQEHAVTVDFDGAFLATRDVDAVKQAFDRVHQQRYGFSSADERAEIVSLRLSVTGVVSKPDHGLITKADTTSADAALLSVRPVEYGILGGRIETPIYDRARLRAGHKIHGPALIQEYASTTVLSPGDELVVDSFGNLDINVEVG